MKRLFISDLHLAPGLTRISDGFHRFLAEKCVEIDELYILGDLFEAWLGDDDTSTYNQGIAAALNALPGRVYLMHGNRDFLLGDGFCRAAGAELLPDPTFISLDGIPSLLMHGDSLCTRDTAYMEARQVLRSPAFQADFLSKPLEERAEFARQLRGESQTHTRESAADIMDVTPQEVIRVMSDTKADVLIHGHTHRPDVHHVSLERGNGTRYVLGDWHETMDYLEVSDGQFNFCRYPLA